MVLFCDLVVIPIYRFCFVIFVLLVILFKLVFVRFFVSYFFISFSKFFKICVFLRLFCLFFCFFHRFLVINNCILYKMLKKYKKSTFLFAF